MERRTYTADELRAADDGTMLTGHAAVFNDLSEPIFGFREMVAPGAFRDSLGSDDIRALWQHDPSAPLGRVKAGTLRLREDRVGLSVEIDMPDTTVGRDALVSVKRGDVSQMSFGFDVLADSWDFGDPDMPKRTLDKVRLYEVSPVTFPAYSNTNVQARDYEGAVASMRRAAEQAAPRFRRRIAECRIRILDLMRV